MNDVTRMTHLVQMLVRLPDTLADDYDVLDVLQDLADSCHEILGSTAAGILLADADGRLEVAASTDESGAMVEVYQVAARVGPCMEAHVRGEFTSIVDTERSTEWPDFCAAALREGLRSVHAIPLRLRTATIGTMNLFHDEPGDLSALDRVTAQALADMATIGILQARAIDEAQELGRQLQRALDSRVPIEQAKGFVAYKRGVSPSDAFDLIRARARDTRNPVADVSRQIVERRLDI